jgi:hypothetical protein
MYVLPSSTVSLMILMQVEILEQAQDRYDIEPNFFHGMYQVGAMAYLLFFLTSFITGFSRQSLPLLLSEPIYDAYSARRPIMPCRRLLTSLLSWVYRYD